VAEIQGSYDDLFTAVPAVLAGLLDAGDVGASVAVFVDGEPVVDVWGGFADHSVWRPATGSRTWAWDGLAVVRVRADGVEASGGSDPLEEAWPGLGQGPAQVLLEDVVLPAENAGLR